VGRTSTVDCCAAPGGSYGVGGGRRRAVTGETTSVEEEARWCRASTRLRGGQHLAMEACREQIVTVH
jgi:hypothetical protein